MTIKVYEKNNKLKGLLTNPRLGGSVFSYGPVYNGKGQYHSNRRLSIDQPKTLRSGRTIHRKLRFRRQSLIVYAR